MFPSTKQSNPLNGQRGALKNLQKPSTRSATAGARKALGDITNAHSNSSVGGLQLKKSTGLRAQASLNGATSSSSTVAASSAAAVAAAPSSLGVSAVEHALPTLSADELLMDTPPDDRSTTSMMQSTDAKKGGGRGGGAPTPASDAMDLAHELDEIEMHVEMHHELGGLTDNMQTMSIQHLQLQQQQQQVGVVDDIDAADADDPLAVTDYVEDQYQYYRLKEQTPGYDPMYMVKQLHINGKMRAILVDWLVEVAYKFKLLPETLYLTVNVLDRFLDRKMVPRTKLQLVGVSALLIASKYEEIYPPEVKELVYMTDGSFDKKQILDMEAKMLEVLKWKVTVCTPYHFLLRYLKAAHADSKMTYLASYICERTLLELDILHFLPSMVAASCVWLARKNCGRQPWSATLAKYTGYREDMLAPCLRTISPWLAGPRYDETQAIRKKYCSSRFHRVAQLDLRA